jgi:hypothetical protein
MIMFPPDLSYLLGGMVHSILVFSPPAAGVVVSSPAHIADIHFSSPSEAVTLLEHQRVKSRKKNF